MGHCAPLFYELNHFQFNGEIELLNKYFFCFAFDYIYPSTLSKIIYVFYK